MKLTTMVKEKVAKAMAVTTGVYDAAMDSEKPESTITAISPPRDSWPTSTALLRPRQRAQQFANEYKTRFASCPHQISGVG